MPREMTARHLQSRRQLITSLVVGGGVIVALGYCADSILSLVKQFQGPPPLDPARLPVDKHRVLNLPVRQYPLDDYTWLPDSTHLLWFDFQYLSLLDVLKGKQDWAQPSAFPPQGMETQILWSSKRIYVALVGRVGSEPYQESRAVVWDIQSRQQVWESLPLLETSFYPFALAPSGTSCALCQDTGDSDEYNGSTIVQIWDILQNHLVKHWNVQEQRQEGDFTVYSMAWSPDSTRLLVICSGGAVQLWDIASGSRLWSYALANGKSASVQWSPDGTTLALYIDKTLGMPILILDASIGKLLFQIASTNDINIWQAQQNGDVVWSGDGKRLAWLTNENMHFSVHVCDAHTGQHIFTCQPVDGQLMSCSWSPDGRYLVAGIITGSSTEVETYGVGSTLQFWDAQSGKALFAYQAPRAPGQLVWSPDSHFLAIYTPQRYELMDFHIGFSDFALQVFRVA